MYSRSDGIYGNCVNAGTCACLLNIQKIMLRVKARPRSGQET